LLDRMPPYFLRVISLAGGLFVLYLAWRKSWRAGSDPGQAAQPALAAAWDEGDR
jgi:threonine/homoserine/homoserine lactone efflux protein